MQIELKESIVTRLLGMPETGMGYQIVDLLLVDGRVVPNVKIFNCELANVPDNYPGIEPEDIADVRLVPSETPFR